MAAYYSKPSVLCNKLKDSEDSLSTSTQNVLKIQTNLKQQRAHPLTELMEICCINDEHDDEKVLMQDILSNQPFHRIYIFDFDDTIFPTSIVQKNVKIWDHTEASTIDEYPQCKQLYIAIKQCMDYILDIRHKLITKYGSSHVSFVVITNASSEWLSEIKNSHSSLISNLLHKLQSVVPIISAKDEFEDSYDDWYSECATLAKTESFTKYVESLSISDKIPIIYCIGDGNPEYEASKLMVQELFEDNDEYYILHRIWLKTNRKAQRKLFKSISQFADVLQTTQRYLFDSDHELIQMLQTLHKNDEDSDTDDAFIIDYEI